MAFIRVTKIDLLMPNGEANWERPAIINTDKITYVEQDVARGTQVTFDENSYIHLRDSYDDIAELLGATDAEQNKQEKEELIKMLEEAFTE